MENWSEKTCSVCRTGSLMIDRQILQAALAELPDWSLVTVAEVEQLERVYRFKNFVQAMGFTGAVGDLAEQYGHHPALLTEWGRVKVSWWTHKINGLHENDVIMAAKTEQLFLSRFAAKT